MKILVHNYIFIISIFYLCETDNVKANVVHGNYCSHKSFSPLLALIYISFEIKCIF